MSFIHVSIKLCTIGDPKAFKKYEKKTRVVCEIMAYNFLSGLTLSFKIIY